MLSSSRAERARLARLGDELATRQSAVLPNGQQRSLLREADPVGVTLVTRPTDDLAEPRPGDYP